MPNPPSPAGPPSKPTDALEVLGRLSGDVPASLIGHLESWSSGAAVVSARSAASVVLLREVDSQLQTYLLHRHARMPFAPNMVVFPGGRVDPDDGDEPTLAQRRCALRETEEETGVRLADCDLLAWAHWITPEFEPRRYDTAFFVAALPEGQQARDISGETDRAEWSGAAEALQRADAGEIGLMPPTRSILLELADLGSLAEVWSAGVGRRITPVLPRAEQVDGHWRFRYPHAGADTEARREETADLTWPR